MKRINYIPSIVDVENNKVITKGHLMVYIPKKAIFEIFDTSSGGEMSDIVHQGIYRLEEPREVHTDFWTNVAIPLFTTSIPGICIQPNKEKCSTACLVTTDKERDDYLFKLLKENWFGMVLTVY